MDITLMHYTPLDICSFAIRTCWQSFEKSDNGGERDRELIERVGNRYRHSSTLEHLVYTFYIKGISRAVLQELSRHRMASLSVKSTRYTLKELKSEEPFNIDNLERAERYVVLTENRDVNRAIINALNGLQSLLKKGISNDIAKYALPEAYRTELTWTINARSLQNFLELRTAKSALWEIRELAYRIYSNIPDRHRYLFKDFVNKKNG